MIKIKNEILIILLFVFTSFGCKETKTKEITSVNNDEVALKKHQVSKSENNNNTIKKECFEKIGSTKSEENKVADFKYFSLQAVSKDFRTHLILKNKVYS